jgi:hypothetical protein
LTRISGPQRRRIIENRARAAWVLAARVPGGWPSSRSIATDSGDAGLSQQDADLAAAGGGWGPVRPVSGARPRICGGDLPGDIVSYIRAGLDAHDHSTAFTLDGWAQA